MKPRNSRTGMLGFTLIEVLLAAFIMSFALLGILALQTASVRSATGGRGRETAVYLCQTLADSVQTEAQRLSLTTGFAIPGAGTATAQFFPPAPVAGTQYFDINGKPATLANHVFKVDWARMATRDATPNCFEFAVIAAWSFETTAANAPIVRAVQINRLVRLG
jgi:Tfp pilus assembly protein PilV